MSHPRGLTTPPHSYGTRVFAVRFDFLDHLLQIETSDGKRSAIALFPRPSAAWYSPELGEFLLRYQDVRNANDPDALVLAFLQSTCEAATNLARWDCAALES